MDEKDFICKLYGLKDIFKTIKADVKTINNGRLKKSKVNSENARAAGNKLYTQKNCEKDTLMYYTKSIAYAPEDSEELALGFSNRSALLLHLRYYKECLVDINRALEITKSDQLKSKLQSRKEKCLLLHEQSMTNKRTEKTVKKLKLPDVTSFKIPCAAEFVSIKSHNTYKRQLIATRNIKPGEIVITEKAYACCPETEKIYLVCSHCLSFACNGIPCDFCAYVIYCSETCKEEAWKEYHDIECSILHTVHAALFQCENIVGSSNGVLNQNCGARDLILLARVFIKAVKTEGLQNMLHETELIDNGSLDLFSDGAFESNKFGYIYNLRCRPQNKTSENDKHFCLEFLKYSKEMSILYLLIKRTNLIPVAKKRRELNTSDERLLLRLRDILMKLKGIIDLNTHGYKWYKCPHQDLGGCGTTCYTNQGVFIAPFSALINHSCVANLCRFTLPQPKNIAYALKPIKKGEQLTISFGPTFTIGNVAERNRYLEQAMHYPCDCIACKNQESFNEVDKKRGYSKFLKVMSEFKRIFGNHCMDFFFSEADVEKWAEPTEASLKQALKLIELFHKYFKFEEACVLTVPLEFYLMRAFHELYDGKCAILGFC